MTDVVLLPGIIAPAAIRYAALLSHLDGVSTMLHDLEVYRGDAPPEAYSIRTEVAGVSRAADTAGLDRFHIYGHSGGGAVALAYATEHPGRLLSLAVDEPAMDFTAAGNAEYGWDEFEVALGLPPAEAMRTFMRLQVSDAVELPPPPGGPPPLWMSTRDGGIRAFIAAARAYDVAPERYSMFAAPVYFSRGSLTHPRWIAMQARLALLFPDFTSEVYQGLHHLNTAHQAEPARVAHTLRDFWDRAEARSP